MHQGVCAETAETAQRLCSCVVQARRTHHTACTQGQQLCSAGPALSAQAVFRGVQSGCEQPSRGWSNCRVRSALAGYAVPLQGAAGPVCALLWRLGWLQHACIGCMCTASPS
jgi:hypothetical protein